MNFKRTWQQEVVHWRGIAAACNRLVAEGWSVHTILPTSNVGGGRDKDDDDGAIIVCFKDEPDLSGGVPR